MSGNNIHGILLKKILLNTTFHVMILDYFMIGDNDIAVLIKPCKLSLMLAHVILQDFSKSSST